MFTREQLERFRRVTVMGLGLFGGGAGVARYFANLGAKVTVTDAAGPETLAASVEGLAGMGIRFVLGEHRREDFLEADLVVANQAVRPDNEFLALARGKRIPVVTETGLALALNPAPWLGVTGSAGKSTTSSLVAAILKEHDPDTLFGGNIGGDLVTRVERQPPRSPVVVELSSYQLAYIGENLAAGDVKPPMAAVVTNITPNHLDWHPDMEDYVAAKQSLVRWQSESDWAVLNHDDPILLSRENDSPGRTIWCSPVDNDHPDASFQDGDDIVLRLEGEGTIRFSLKDFKLLGGHNRQNALQAVAAAWVTCRNPDAVRRALAAFPGLPHRLEAVGRAGGRLFINDSKATTPEAACVALRELRMPKVLIAGGYDKNSPFDTLGTCIQEHADGLVLLGAAAGRLRKAVMAAAGARPPKAGTLPVAEAGDDFARAVRTAWEMTPAGGAVLLSPACASWGMFANYEERGRVFAEIARELEKPC